MGFSIKVTIIASIVLTVLLMGFLIGFLIYKKKQERAKVKAEVELRNKYRSGPKAVEYTGKKMDDYGKRIGAQNVEGGLVMDRRDAPTSQGVDKLTKPTGPMSGITRTVGPTTHTIIAVPEEGGDDEEGEEEEEGDEEEEGGGGGDEDDEEE